MRTAEQRPKSVTSSDAAPNPEAPQEDRFRKQDWPFYWITQVSARYMQVMEVRLKRIGLDVPSWRVLMCLHEDDWLSVSQIADYSIIKLNTATRIIQRMESQGLVCLRPRPEDLRVTEVSLTIDGDAQRQKAREVATSIFDASFEDLSPGEQQLLNELMERVFLQLGKL
ncbi:MarR family winged helix-turn-helix transcriptional regulator [Chachezhania antarctica]|uniref:MarR family winged helix-turn-helix transcriptional regulator n=1 Tax=Chachezhania antarctica TaxID=2340860 RepID=UPI000EACFFEB|nr:MarR family transcriptional regulator [Chachezhania antarctica]|tara:strand:- start:1307 stop:1813 length:507 start_codon:yes stop_codon:yes gene_type:complete